MHCDAPSCTVMHRDGFINFWIAPNSTELLFIALYSSFLHHDAPRCTKMHRDAPRCTEYHRVGCMYFECTELHQAILLILICTVMHRDAPRCTMMHRVLLSYYILYYLYLGKVTAIMRFCFSVHHGASRCITVHHGAFKVYWIAPWMAPQLYLGHGAFKVYWIAPWMAPWSFI